MPRVTSVLIMRERALLDGGSPADKEVVEM